MSSIEELRAENERLTRELADSRRAAARLGTMFEHAVEAILVCRMVDGRTGAILAANPATALLTGYTVDELHRMRGHDLTVRGITEAPPPWRGRLFAEGWAEGDDVLRKKDGSLVFAELRVGVVDFDGEPAALFFMRDVTERKRLEREREEALRALGESEERHRVLFEHAPDAIFVCRVEGGCIGPVLAANAATLALGGYVLDELRRLRARDVSERGRAAQHPPWLKRLLSQGSAEGEDVAYRKDGAEVPVEIRVRLVDFAGERAALFFARDVSEQKRLEREREEAVRELRASEERYRMMFENAAEAILVFGVEGEGGGRVLAANTAAAALTGYTVTDLRALHRIDLLAPEQREEADPRMERLLSAGWLEGQSLVRKKDGTTIPVDFRTGLAHLDGERVALAFGHDASEQRRAEGALREAKRMAEEESRAKSSFLANMSHEIRTPMNAILGYVQLLQRDPALTGDQGRYLRIIDRAGDHLLEMINDVLEMSKIEAGVRQLNDGPFDLPGLFEDLTRMFQLRADTKRIGFALHLGPGVPRQVVADEGKLRQVAVNLLSNAVRLTQRGGVAVRLSFDAAGPGDARLAVEVEDTGPGISADEMERLFRPFEQARAGASTRGGTGLGLALSRELVRLMGGEITVSSRVGVGSAFRFAVPVTVVAPTAEEEVARSARPLSRIIGLAGPGSPPRVLVVDDSDDGRTWICLLLQQIGFEVREAEDGLAALAQYEAWAPHLVLMDLQMPGMDGFATIGAMRARPSARPPIILALTASVLGGTGAACLSAGADGWLGKPCRDAELLEAIGRHLGVHYRREATPRSPCPRGPAPDVAGLPPDLAAPLREAAQGADYDRLRGLIDALPPAHAATAAELGRFAEDYAYDRIEAFLA